MFFCGCASKSFWGSVAHSLSQCQTSPMPLQRPLCRLWLRWCRAAAFCGEDVDRARILQSVYSHSTQKDCRTVLFPCPARLIDKTAWAHLAAAHTTFLYPFAFGCRCVNVSHVCVDGTMLTATTDVCTLHHARALSDVGSRMAVGSLKQFALCRYFVSTQCCNHASHNG